MAIKFLNNASGTVGVTLAIGGGTLEVATGHGDRFPAVSSPDYFYGTLADSSGNKEIVKVTARTAGADTMTITRAQESTSAREWQVDDVFELRLTAGVVQGICADIVTNAAGIATNASDLSTLETTLSGALSAPSGLKMYFYENTAPTGWTYDSGVTDRLLAVKGGAAAYNANGQTTAGTWTQTGHTHTGPSHTHTGPSHTHTYTQVINHTHTVSTKGATGSGLTYLVEGALGSDSTNVIPTPSGAVDTGTTAASGTGATSASGTGATGSSSEANTYRPAAAIGIIATKD